MQTERWDEPPSLQAQKLGSRIRELREYRGIFQDSFAEQCGSSQQYISAVEAGRKLPTIRQLLRMAAILHCDLDVVLQPKELT